MDWDVGSFLTGTVNDIVGQPQKNNDSQNTALNDTWKFVTNAYEDAVSGALGGVLGLKAKDSVSGALSRSPGAPIKAGAQPTLADATAPVIRDQLSAERRAASASSILTGGAGLLDQPTTMSRTLLGS